MIIEAVLTVLSDLKVEIVVICAGMLAAEMAPKYVAMMGMAVMGKNDPLPVILKNNFEPSGTYWHMGTGALSPLDDARLNDKQSNGADSEYVPNKDRSELPEIDPDLIDAVKDMDSHDKKELYGEYVTSREDEIGNCQACQEDRFCSAHN